MNTPIVPRIILVVGLAALAPTGALAAASSLTGNGAPPDQRIVQLMRDSSFEGCPAGALASASADAAWEVWRTGRDAIQDRLVVDCVEDAGKAHSGRKCLLLSIPKDTAGFECITVGQRPRLKAGKEYEASIWARWIDGPDEAPAEANAISGRPSAIVSFWARHRDGKGSFAGRDVWLFDNHWRKLAFRFRATDPEQRTFVYVSLLPNQKLADTAVLADDFELAATDAPAETESRSGNLVGDSGFDAQRGGGVVPPWNRINRGGAHISIAPGGAGEQRWVTLRMPAGTSNLESAQLWQRLDLRRGARYEVRCRMRWDNCAPNAPAPIVNFGIYHEDSNAWYGPVDQTLEKNGEWNTYRFVHAPPFSGPWKLYVQLNGWGNFGRAVEVSVDDFTCAPVRLDTE